MCELIYCVWRCNDSTVLYGTLESVCACYGAIEIIFIIIIIIMLRLNYLSWLCLFHALFFLPVSVGRIFESICLSVSGMTQK